MNILLLTGMFASVLLAGRWDIYLWALLACVVIGFLGLVVRR